LGAALGLRIWLQMIKTMSLEAMPNGY